MAIDPRPPVRPNPADPGSIIDNEISAYRAITPLAIFAAIFGLLSILTYVNTWFASFGVLAVVSAVLARRSIRRVPDILTGGRLADVGVALAILFCLSALTVSWTQDFLIRRSASRFAASYLEVLRDGSVDDNVYMQSSPAMRKGKTPKQVSDEYMKSSPNPMAFEQQVRPFREIKARLVSTPGQSITFERIGGLASDGIEAYANALYAIKGPPSKDFPGEVQYAAVQFKGSTEVAGFDWYVKEIQFPLAMPPTSK